MGNFITKIGEAGKGPGQLEDPEHLAIDSDGNIYVSDRGNNRIQVFKPISGMFLINPLLKVKIARHSKIASISFLILEADSHELLI